MTYYANLIIFPFLYIVIFPFLYILVLTFTNSPKTVTSNRRVKLNSHLIERLNAYKVKCQKYVGFENSWYIFGCLNPLSTTTAERKKISIVKYLELSKLKYITLGTVMYLY